MSESEGWLKGAGAASATVLSVAALITSIRSSSLGWLGVTAQWIVTALVAVVVVALGAVALAAIIAGSGWGTRTLVLWVLKQDEAPAIIPAILAALSAVLGGLSDELLPDRPAMRWSLVITTAVVTLTGAMFAYLGVGRAVTIAGFATQVVPALVVAVTAFTVPWWEQYKDLPHGDQVLLGSSVTLYIAALATATILGLSRHGKHPDPRPLLTASINATG